MHTCLKLFVLSAVLLKMTMSKGKTCNVQGDIVFLIDGSASINDADFMRVKTFVANLIDNFEISTDAMHVGIIVYSTLVREKYGLYPLKNKAVLKTLAVNLKHPKAGTYTAAGIEAARGMITQQGRSGAPKIIIVITYGRSTNDKIVQSYNTKDQGIKVIAVGVGSYISLEELNKIASSPKYVSKVADFSALAETVTVTRDLICTSMATETVTMTTRMTAPITTGRSIAQ